MGRMEMQEAVSTAPTRRRPGRPARLSREQIVESAVAIADGGGLEAVTMRTVAHRLGAEAMSLYRHVANKEDLVDGMIDLVYGEIELPDPAAPWPDALRARAISARAALVRHPWSIALMESRTRPGPMNLRHHEALLGVLVRFEYSAAGATRIVNILDSYTYGFALQEASLPVATPEALAEAMPDLLAQLPTGEYPLLARAAQEFMDAGFDYRAEFEVGLDLVLDALQRTEKAPE